MSDHETRDPPAPGTATAAPGFATPSDPQEAVGTVGQTPEQAEAVATAAATWVDLPVIPGYVLHSELGRGGMGTVYRAREIAFDRDVAIKLLHPRYQSDSPGTRRFLEEARITGQLQHPSIPPVHHIGTLPDGRPFLAMKLIKGDTLADLLEREPDTGRSADRSAGRQAGRARFVAAFAQVCQALAYAHSRKVIHRDLKPSNVMVGAFGEVQVMDWGLAKVLTSDGCAPLEPTEVAIEATEIRTQREPDSATQTGAVLGTPAYMAPEQAAGEVEKVDERADVFGLGAMLCVILTGKPPYSGPSTDAIRLKAIRGETTDALARLDACEADPELIALCKQCLATNYEERPRNAGEVARDVMAHLAAVEERARQAELDRIRAEEEQKRERERLEAEHNLERVRAEEERKRLVAERQRRLTQYMLVGAVLLLLVLVASGAGLASLWSDAESAKKDAEGARDTAENARRNLESANSQLADQKKASEADRDKAKEQQSAAEKAQAAEEEARKKLQVFEYGRTMQVAHQEWRNNNLVAMRALLDRTGGIDDKPRKWERHYLNRLYDPALLTLRGHRYVLFASFSPDDSRVVTAGDNVAKVWDAKTGQELLTLKGHTANVNSASFSADGSRVVTGSDDQTAKVWDAKTGQELLTLKGHIRSLSSANFSADGAQVATGSYDGTAKVWDAKTGAEVLTFKGHTEIVRFASFSPDGSRVVTAGDDQTAKVWDAKSGAEVLTFKGHTGYVFAASFSPDGDRVVTAGDDQTAKVWDSRSGVARFTFKGHTNRVISASFSRDGTRIVTGSFDRTARVWEVPPPKLDGVVESGKEVLTLKGHTGNVNSASFSADGSRVVTAGDDGTARVWDAKTGAEFRPLEKGGSSGKAVNVSPDGALRVAVSDGKAQVWNTKPEVVLFELQGHTAGVITASFSPDGSRIVTGGADHTARVWDTITGAEVLTLKGHKSRVIAVSFSADGSRIVTSDDDRETKVWDAGPSFREALPKEPAPREVKP